MCIDKLPHSCGTRKGLQVFADDTTGLVTGFCFACNTFIQNPYGKPVKKSELDLPPEKTQSQIDEEVAEVQGFQTMDIPSRKLRAADLDAFGVKVAVNEEDGKTPHAMYFPQTRGGEFVGYYAKTISKPSFTWSLGDVKKADPFGWNEAISSGAYKLIITEGLEDAIAVKKIYKAHGKAEYQPAVVSLPNGVNSVKSALSERVGEIKRSFREVILCFDNDEAGKKATEAAMLMMPFAKVVVLPCKDANDCVIEGRQAAAYKALSFDAHVPKNTRIITAKELHGPAREPTPYGDLTWPFPTLNKIMRHIRYGETIYIGAGVKMGKSELLNHIAAWFISEHNVPVFMAKPEEANKKSYKMLCNKIAGKVFTDPDIEFDYEAYDKAGEKLDGKLFMVDLYQHLGWETLKMDIIAAASMGAKAIFIDPITNLTNGMESGDANSMLSGIAQDLSSMALDLDVVIFIFCHLKTPDGNISKDVRLKKYKNSEYIGLGNCPHEYGGDVLSSQFAGSRAMMRSCNLMIGLEGNKDQELPEHIRQMRWLSILEDREFGNSRKIPIIWNGVTTRFKEVI